MKNRRAGKFYLKMLFLSLEMSLSVNLKLFSRRSQLKGLDKLVPVDNSVSLPRSPAGRDILDALGDERKRLALRCRAIKPVVINKAFDVELPQHKLLFIAIVAEQAPVLVYFTL